MFPEQFAADWIERLTEPGDLVIDPFCGRGTTPFQALLMGRAALGNDTNPVACCVTRAKTRAPSLSQLRRRLTILEREFDPGEWTRSLDGLPEFFRHAFASATLKQLVYLRERLSWRTSDIDGMIAAIALGQLHGEARSPSYLSNQMPRTISTKPEYSVRYWKKHGHVAPDRDAFALIRDRAAFRYSTPPPAGRGTTILGDMRELPFNLEATARPARLAVTSPPYMNVTSYEEDQWLRLWLLGGASHPAKRQISQDDRIHSETRYWRFIADMWRTLSHTLGARAHVVIRMGARRRTPEEVVGQLEASAALAPRPTRLLSHVATEIKGRQTNSFRPGAEGCTFEVDCVFQVA